MISIIQIVSSSIMLHNYHFSFVMGIIKIYFLSKFDDYNTIKSIFTTKNKNKINIFLI